MTTKQASIERTSLPAAGLLLRLGQRLAVDDPHGAIESRAQAAVQIVLANFGDELFFDQASGDGIRHRRVSTHFRPRCASPGRSGRSPRRCRRSADPPCLRHPDGERFDRLRIGRPGDRVPRSGCPCASRSASRLASSSRFCPAVSAPVISNTRPVNGGIGAYSAMAQKASSSAAAARRAKSSIISSLVLRRPGLGEIHGHGVLRWPVRFRP